MKQSDKSQQTKAKLLESARQLINEKGYEDTSVEDITKKAGVAKGTFYHYFTMKEDVVHDLCFASYQEGLKKALEMKAPITDRITYFIISLCEDAAFSGISLCRQWLKTVLDPEGLQRKQSKYFHFINPNESLDQSIHSLTALLQSGIDRKELVPMLPFQTLLKLLISHIYGLFAVWCLMNGAIDIMKEARTNVKVDIENMLRPYLVKA